MRDSKSNMPTTIFLSLIRESFTFCVLYETFTLSEFIILVKD